MRRFPPPRMTNAANRNAFRMWLFSATDAALDKADTISLARSYGIDPLAVGADIQHQRALRRAQV